MCDSFVISSSCLQMRSFNCSRRDLRPNAASNVSGSYLKLVCFDLLRILIEAIIIRATDLSFILLH